MAERPFQFMTLSRTHFISGFLFPSAVFGCVLSILILTMPASIYPGDANAIRFAAEGLLKNGVPGIPFEEKEKIGSFLSVDGQYFIKNEKLGFYFSRWGELNTLIYAIPLSIEQIVGSNYGVRLWNLNLFHAFVGALVALVLFLLCKDLGFGSAGSSVFVLLCLFSTFAWNYLRAQTYEVFQLLFFLTACYLLNLGLVGSNSRSKIFLLLSATAIGCMVLLKSVYSVLFLPFWLVAWRKERDFLHFFKIIAIGLFFILLHLVIFYLKSGYFGISGEGVAIPGSAEPFALSNLVPRAREYLYSPKGSLFLHFPIIIGAVFFWPRFFRSHGRLSFFLLGSFLVYAIPHLFFFTRGELCYGPRYFLFILPLLSLPILYLFSIRKTSLKVSLILLILSFGLVLGFREFQMNSRHWFLQYGLQDYFSKIDSPTINAYLASHSASMIALDFNLFINGDDEWPILSTLKFRDEREISNLRKSLVTMSPCNFNLVRLCP